MVVAFRTSATGQVNASPVAATLTAPAVAGDTAIMALSHGATAITWTVPPGWTQIGTSMSTNSQTLAVYSKTLVSGEIGVPITATASISGKQAVAITVWSGASGVIGGSAPGSSSTTATTRTTAALACTGTCIEIMSSKAATGPGTWTVPTSFTSRAAIAQTGTGAVTLGVASSSSDLNGSDVWTLDISTSQYQSLTLWLTASGGGNLAPNAVASSDVRPDTVEYRTGTANQSNAASVTATIPSTARVGDYGIAVHTIGITGLTSSAPAGWTLQGSAVSTSSQSSSLFSKVLTAGDINTVLSFAAVGGTGKQAVTIVVYSGADENNPFGGLAVASAVSSVRFSRTSPTLSGLYRLVEIMVSKGTDPGIWTPPEGFLLRHHVEQTSTGAVTVGIADSTTDLVGPNTWTLDVSTSQYASWGLWLNSAAGGPLAVVEPYETMVKLDGSASSDPDGTIAGYAWAQTDGVPSVTLAGSGAVRTFVAPGSLAGDDYTFQLTVTDNSAATDTDAVNVTVMPATERIVVGSTAVPLSIQIVETVAAVTTNNYLAGGTVSAVSTVSGSATARLAAAGTAAAVSTVSGSTTVVPLPIGAPALAWSMVFQDEFDGSALDTTRWIAQEMRELNNVFTRTSNVSVSGGNMVLQLSSESGTIRGSHVSSDPFDGAGVNGYVMEIGDYVEARCFFPSTATEEMCNWSAFWTSSSNETWPINGETDIVEGLGGDPSVNYHYGPSPAGHIASNQDATTPTVWGDSWHTYGAYRRPNYVDVYWDGVLMRSIKSNDLGNGQCVVATVGKSGSRTPILGGPGALLIDYVRAWRAPVTEAIVPNWPFTFTATVASDTSISCTWGAATVPLGGGAVTGYRIYDGLELVGTFGNVLSGTVTGLGGGNPYVLTVRAVNAAGESVRGSSSVSVTTTYTVPALTSGTISRGTNITSAETSSGTTLVVNRPTGTADGDLLVVAYGGGPITTPTISGSGWTLRGSLAQGINVAVWTKYITDITSEPSSYTITGNTSSGRISASINRYIGTNQFSTLDAAAVSTSKANGVIAGSTLTLASITTVTPKAVLYAACAGDFASTNYIKEPTGMARTWQSTGTGRRLSTADEYRGTAGATGTRSFTESASGTNELDGVILAIRPAPIPLGGAITRKLTTLAEANGVTSLAGNKPSGLVDGDVLVAGVVFSGGTPTGPAGWTLMKMQGAGSGAVVSSLWIKVITTASSEPSTYTWSCAIAANRVSVGITAYSGVNNTTPQDLTAIGATLASGAGQTDTVASVTTVTAGAVLVSCAGMGSASSPVIVGPTGMNEVWHSQGTGRQGVFDDEYRASTGATGTRDWTQVSPNVLEMQACLGALRPA